LPGVSISRSLAQIPIAAPYHYLIMILLDGPRPVTGPYEYRDPSSLLADFWAEVDAVLKERGVLR
jgi:hypothetical protein